MGRQRQECLDQAVAVMTPRSSSLGRDHVKYLQEQLTYKDTQLEHAGSQCDTHFVQEEELLAHVRLLSSEAKDWNSHFVSETEHVLVMESAEAAHHACVRSRKPWISNIQPIGDKLKLRSGSRKNPTTLKSSNSLKAFT